jgi:hypothetical protein
MPKIAIPEPAEAGRFASNMPEIELDGEAYKGKYELNTENKTTVFKWLQKEFQGKIYINKCTGNKISISRNGIRELIYFIKDDMAYMKSLVHIPKIIENMQYLETMPNKKNKSYAYFDYYITPIKMSGRSYMVKELYRK